MARLTAATRTAVANQNYGSALQFNGSTQYALRSTNTSLANLNVTYSCWMYTTSLPASIGTAFHNGNASANGAGIEIINTGKFRIEFYGRVTFSSTTTPALLTWYHVAFTRNNTTGLAQLFVNGLLETTITNFFNAPNAFTAVGCSIFNSAVTNNFFPGIVDDCRIYERVLSNQEILDIAHQLPVSASNLKIWYKLDDGSGSTSVDSSGNGFTLTLNNSPTWITPGHVSNTGRVPIYQNRSTATTRNLIT